MKQRIATVRLAYSALSSAEVRIAELLRRLGEIYTEVELTHEEIAGLTGTTRVTVTRALKRLSQSRRDRERGGAHPRAGPPGPRRPLGRIPLRLV